MGDRADYHEKRAEQERLAAKKSGDSVAQALHSELASLHDEKARASRLGDDGDAG